MIDPLLEFFEILLFRWRAVLFLKYTLYLIIYFLFHLQWRVIDIEVSETRQSARDYLLTNTTPFIVNELGEIQLRWLYAFRIGEFLFSHFDKMYFGSIRRCFNRVNQIVVIKHHFNLTRGTYAELQVLRQHPLLPNRCRLLNQILLEFEHSRVAPHLNIHGRVSRLETCRMGSGRT